MEARLLLPEDGRAYAALRVYEAEAPLSGPASSVLALELARLARGPGDVIRNYLDSDTLLWGAFDRHALVGTLAVSRRFTVVVADHLWLWGLFVRPHYRGTPASRVLITAAVEARERRPPEWRLFGAFDVRNLRASRFCERHGFAPVADAFARHLRRSRDETVVERPRGS